LPGSGFDSVLRDPAGRTNWNCQQDAGSTFTAFRQCARTGVNSVFCGQLLNAENRGGRNSVASPAFTPLKRFLRVPEQYPSMARKIFVYKRTGRSKTVTMILT